MRKTCIITVCLLLSAMLVVGGCKTTTETVTKTTTQSAATVTATVTQSASTVTDTVTQPASTVTVTSTAKTSTTATSTTKTSTTATSTTKTTTTTSTTAAETNTQPQTITSDDGNFQIISHKATVEWNGTVTVTGVVKNIGSATATAEVTVDLYTASGLFGTQVDEIKNIPAGETRPFYTQFTVASVRGAAFEYYTVSISSAS